jgi:hypothetical protein
MSTSDRGFFAPLTYDIRVRERLLAAGVVTPAEIQQYLAGLPDNESHTESLAIGQPALNTPQPPAPAPAPIRVSPPVLSSSTASQNSVDLDDDDEDEDEDELQVADTKAEEPAAAAPIHSIAVGEPNPNGVESKEAVEARKDAEAAAEAAAVEAAAVDATPVDVTAPDVAAADVIPTEVEPAETEAKVDESTNQPTEEQPA